MIVQIKRSNGTVYQSVKVGESSKRVWKFMGENTVTLEIEVTDPISFLVGDYILYNTQTYRLNTLPRVRKIGYRRYAYTAVFESTMYDLGKVQYLLFTDDPVNPEPLGTFDLEGTAQTFANQIITNLNRVFSGWSLSGSLPATEYRNLYFEGETCLAALHKICEEFGLEFSFNEKAITINYDLGTSHTRTFRYGKGNGLYELERKSIESKEVITRLYAFGSEKNIPADYRNYSPRLKLASDYVESGVATYGVIEHTEIFEDIFPTREGTVSYVNPADEKIFRDSGLDFDVNDYLLSGLAAKVHFRTGDLAGYSFEINSYTHESGGYPSREFAINVNKDEKDFEVPSSTLKPAYGDKYVLLDIKMPQSYIDAAETALAARAQDFIDKYSKPQVAYDLTIDPIYLSQNPITLAPGDFVKVGDTDISVYEDVRILGLSYPLPFPNRLDVELSEEATPSFEQLLYREQQQLAALQSGANASAISIALLQKKIGSLTSDFDSHNHNDLYYTKTQSDSKYSLTTHDHGTLYAPNLHTHAWADITGKPSTFPPSSHTHTGADITGLSINWADIADKPSTFPPSNHTLLSHTVSGLTAGHFLKALSPTTFGFAAHGLTYSSVGAASSSHNHDTWYAPILHTHPWTEISGKPSTFPPSSHMHTGADITGLSINWVDIADKPSTFPPSSHTHATSDLTGLPTNKILVGNGSSGILTVNELHWDNTNKYLGISTTSPQARIHSNTAGGKQLFLQQYSTGTGDFSEILFGISTAIYYHAAIRAERRATYDADLVFLTQTASSNYADLSEGMRLTHGGTLSINSTSPDTNYKLYVSGRGYFSSHVTVGGVLSVTSTVTASDFILSSDRRLKENIQAVNLYAHDINYYSFNYKNSDRLRFGVIAQELEKVYPNLVTEDEKGFKRVSYTDLHSIEIARLKDRIVELEKLISK